jgi:hypothetical protein
MLLRDMPKHEISLGTFRRLDGETFEVAAQIYESPSTYDFWQIPIRVQHAKWQHMRFVATVPKKIANTVQMAAALVRGPVFEQVKASLASATVAGRDMTLCFSADGWVLV